MVFVNNTTIELLQTTSHSRSFKIWSESLISLCTPSRNISIHSQSRNHSSTSLPPLVLAPTHSCHSCTTHSYTHSLLHPLILHHYSYTTPPPLTHSPLFHPQLQNIYLKKHKGVGTIFHQFHQFI
jgi:hypothetical protein